MSTFIEMNLAVYRTERRSKGPGNNSGDWTPYYVLAYGTLAETNEVLSPVCYLDDVDIYNCIIAERGGNITLSKLQRNPNKQRDCTFHITFEGGDHAFQGVLQDDKGEWEWKGIYLCNQQKTHLKSYVPQVPYSHSLFEIKKHSPSDTDSSPSSHSSSDFRIINPNHTRGSGGGSYACSIRTSVYGVIPLIEEPDDEPTMQITIPNKYDALVKEWSSISTMTCAQAEKSEYNTPLKPLGNNLKYLNLPNIWPDQLSIPSPARSRSRMRLVTTGLGDSNSLHIPRSFTPFTEASEDSFYSIDTEDIPVSSSAYTDSAATIQDASRDQTTPCPPTPQIPEITNQTDAEDDYIVLYRAWRCDPSGEVVRWT
ncbi:unnamed protein product [Rhizoctonia solani]|uniref:Uncharacterized protein n=1 Tax=Rhizoctonia solani TaxID=456999 RepID=A0A8H2WBV1_9AGAM|nr:unnamed protein product [Rhizoctonia solani]